MTHGSLSAGIEGFGHGARLAGVKTVWTCEIDPLRRDVLNWAFPKAKHFQDIRRLRRPPYVDIITFGFPCQDISLQNAKGKGLEGPKSGLWYEGWRVIRAVGPSVIILENSPNLVHKGLGTILWQLANEGYNAEWDVISCKRFGMPHHRKRLFVVAYSDKIRRTIRPVFKESKASIHQKQKAKGEDVLELHESVSQRLDSVQRWTETIAEFCLMDDGLPSNIFQGLLAAAGDSVSPIITAWIFSRIKALQEEIV